MFHQVLATTTAGADRATVSAIACDTCAVSTVKASWQNGAPRMVPELARWIMISS